MAAADRPGEVGETVEHADPREEEMPRARHRQPAIVGNRQPTTGTRDRELAVGVLRARRARRSCRIRVPSTRVTPCMPPSGGHARADHEQRRLPRVRRLAPVERRVRIEDLQPAHQQDRQRDDVDPVHDAHRQRVAVVEARRAERDAGLRRRSGMAPPIGRGNDAELTPFVARAASCRRQLRRGLRP